MKPSAGCASLAKGIFLHLLSDLCPAITLCGMLLCEMLYGADFSALVNDAQKLAQQKDFVAAELKYAEAAKLAVKSSEKYKAYAGQLQALWGEGKNKAADSLVESATEDELLKGTELRRFINLAASHELWGPRPERCLDLLRANMAVNCPTTDNEYFVTYSLLANYFLVRRKLPEIAIQTMMEMVNTPHLHPANYHSCWMLIGNAKFSLGQNAEALESYRKALEWLKKVTYKVDFTETEKKIRKAEEALKKN